MNKLLEGVTIEELSGENYIIKFPIEFLDNGYGSCNDIARCLNNSFPTKNFCWLPDYLTFEELSAPAIEEIIEELKDILKNKEVEQEKIGNIDE